MLEKRTDATKDGGFSGLDLSDRTLKTLEHIGFEQPSPIQAAFIPIAMTGGDCIGQARTGTGKTAAFVLPTLERIDADSKRVQALVLAPTRELSEQVAGEARRLSDAHPVHCASLVGGRPIKHQIEQLERGAQIAVGTPGRVLDLLRRGRLNLNCLEIVVLDEADRMLDIGFRPDIERILRQCPDTRQTLLLSATLPPSVERLAQRYMKDPQRIDMSEDGVAVETIEQFYVTVDNDRKLKALVRILAKERPQQALVFTRTKRGAEKLHKEFRSKLKNQLAMIHGDLHQRKRDRVIRDLRSGKIRLLIATDVVGRGIDVSGISHIVNYDIPEFCDDYIHRVGRTGRMSSDRSGRAITFVMPDQGHLLTNVEKRINGLLEEYRLDDFEAFRPGKPRKTVDDVVEYSLPESSDEEEFSFGVIL